MAFLMATANEASTYRDSCRAALEANHQEITDLKILHQKEEAFTKQLQGQRDSAYREAQDAQPLAPWYFWTAVGFIAGAAVAWSTR